MNESPLTPDSRIFVAGHRGMVGSAIVRRLTAEGYSKVITQTHAELDLKAQQAVQPVFQDMQV